MAEQLQYEQAVANVRPHHLTRLEEEEQKEKQLDIIKMIGCPLEVKRIIR